MSDDGFLSRWSRKKQEAKRGLAEPPPPASVDDEVAPTEPEASTTATGAEQKELSAEDIAILPRIEELTASSDITAFLREGVPLSLRNAALRRLWVVDPSIRDYVGDARDYAYDWSVAGSVPGTGPLLPTDDPSALIDRLFSSANTKPTETETPVENQELPAREAAGLQARNADPILMPGQEGLSGIVQPANTRGGDAELGRRATEELDGPQDASAKPFVKRHGRAVPT